MFSTEPLSIGGVLDSGISLYRSTFKQTTGLALIVAIPYVLAAGLMSYAGAGLTPGAPPEAMDGQLPLIFGAMLLMYPALFFLWGAVGHRIVALARGGEANTSADIGFGLKLMIPLTVVLILFMLALTLGFLLLIIPGLIIMVTMSQFATVPLMEDRSSWSSLWRSHKLIWRGNYWRTAAILTVMSIIGLAVSLGVYLVVGAVSVAQATSEGVDFVYLVIEAFANMALMTLLMPLTLSMLLALYNDLLLRREGGDLDEQLAQLDGGQA